MILTVLAVLVGTGAAFACMMFYRQGVKDGMARNLDQRPAPLINLKDDDDEDLMTDKLAAILEFDPYKDET